jgi:hypothetical protein
MERVEETSNLSALANTDGVDLILNGHSPVFHEIERVEDVKAVWRTSY